MSRIALILFLLTGLSISGHTQLNLKIGYEAAYVQSKENKRLVNAFNEKNEVILAQGKEMSTLGLNNGLLLGLSYTWETSRVSVNWHSTSSKHTAFGEIMNPQMSFEKSMRYKLAGFGLQYEMLIGRLSLGFGAGRDQFTLTSLIEGSNNDKTIIKENELNVRFNFGFELLRTKRVTLVIEPFVTYVAGYIDHRPAYPFLDVPRGNEIRTDRPHYFGVQLIFYNGPQGENR